MVTWGHGFFQSDDDAEVVADLETMFGFQLCPPFGSEAQATPVPKFDRATIADKLNDDNLLYRKLSSIMTSSFLPLTAHHKRERIAVLLGMLAMQVGAELSDEHLVGLRMLRCFLPNAVQQVQLVTALDGYANDGVTPWISGSKTFAETMQTRDHDGGGDEANPYWHGGIGHSANKPPVDTMKSVTCMQCGNNEMGLRRCTRCRVARYCGSQCQKVDWRSHKQACHRLEGIPWESVKNTNDAKSTETREAPTMEPDKHPTK